MPHETQQTSLNGHCLCGAVCFTSTGTQSWACYCHCHDCRRNCAAPVVAFLGVKLDGFQWHLKNGNASPRFFNSSPGVKRFFCDECGTPMAFQAEHYPGEIHLYATTLDDPDAFVPKFHVHHDRKLAWLPLSDDLPKYQASAPADESKRK